MLTFEGFTLLILFLILAPITGAISLLFLFIFEKRVDLLENENKKMELQKELQEARVHQLNQQIQPHFLFNTLNVILSLARLQRTKELIRALELFSLFLKFKYQTTQPLIPLFEEIRFTEYYIEIQKLRFGSRLKIELDCHTDLVNALIPPFVLQTLVENAFKHALEMKEGEALLDIRITGNQEHVLLRVTDNGSATVFEESLSEVSGHGLDNIRRRLHLYFGDQSYLQIRSINGAGTEVKVQWPLIEQSRMKEVIK